MESTKSSQSLNSPIRYSSQNLVINQYVMQTISQFMSTRQSPSSSSTRSLTMAHHISRGNQNFWESSELAVLKARTQALLKSQSPVKSKPTHIKSEPQNHRSLWAMSSQTERKACHHTVDGIEAKGTEKENEVHSEAASVQQDLMPKRFFRDPLLSRILNQPNKKSRRCTCPNCISGLGTVFIEDDGSKRKVHVCIVCGKTYGKTSHLTAHLRWHNNERPFQCSFQSCSKAFTRSDELQRHMRTHTGDKKFACNLCSKRFMRSDHLNKHKKIHSSIAVHGRRCTKGVFPTPPVSQSPHIFSSFFQQPQSTIQKKQTSMNSSLDSGIITDHVNSLLASNDL